MFFHVGLDLDAGNVADKPLTATQAQTMDVRKAATPDGLPE